MTNCVSVLGSTGSIGRQTLEVVGQLGIRVAALAAGANVERMAQQCREYRPELAVMATPQAANALRDALGTQKIRILSGPEGLLTAAVHEQADTVVTAVVGMLGLKPTLAAIRQKKRIALANKETLVCAGELVMAAAREYGAEILPVDSEHSAIFQCLMGCTDRREIRRLLLTCSGGPFYGRSREELGRVTRADALCHPNWKMGQKITVDCATLMNKGLEVIEAMRLYSLPLSQVDVLIHRQSIVHSLVEFRDGAVLAQLGVPDMRVPIRLAMTYPERAENPAAPLDLTACGALTFAAPDYERFPASRWRVKRRSAAVRPAPCSTARMRLPSMHSCATRSAFTTLNASFEVRSVPLRRPIVPIWIRSSLRTLRRAARYINPCEVLA